MRWTKGLLKQELGRLGLTLKGFEVRGGRLADALLRAEIVDCSGENPFAGVERVSEASRLGVQVET